MNKSELILILDYIKEEVAKECYYIGVNHGTNLKNAEYINLSYYEMEILNKSIYKATILNLLIDLKNRVHKDLRPTIQSYISSQFDNWGRAWSDHETE